MEHLKDSCILSGLKQRTLAWQADESQLELPRPSIFGRYSCFWFGPLVDALTSGDGPAAGIHYILRDACLVLLSWPDLWPPVGKNMQLTVSAAGCLMDHLVRFLLDSFLTAGATATLVAMSVSGQQELYICIPVSFASQQLSSCGQPNLQ